MWESLSGFEKKNVWKFIGFSGRLLSLTTTKIEFIWVKEIGISSVSTVCQQEKISFSGKITENYS